MEMKVIFLLLTLCFSAQAANCKLQRCPKGCWCRCRTQTDRPPPPIYSGSADASSSSCAAGKRNREHEKNILRTWKLGGKRALGGGRNIKSSRNMGGWRENWGEWEYGSMGTSWESKAQEPSRQRGKLGKSWATARRKPIDFGATQL